ncbi:50S ribosomal protein L5 [Horticoccus luteus]|uniref:Large ribosomal subunit protein uL5 n=1 Tax=Horticoccus luteus TaxID=2862869 RepID=A0A8F9TXM5_9BACT|nr:50S ribosomal protein L5 [Horticoccus luteus]QYM79744.1 50S ribosomal protein L5 [Horticoccus luteus]
MSKVPSLKKLYTEQVVPELVKSRGYKNHHQVPKVTKVVINTGIDADADKNQITDIQRDIGLITGQKAVLTKSRKAIANFKLRQGQVVGSFVTLRGNSMWEFLQRLIAVALPTIRDFRGISPKLDGQGNYNLGVSDHTIFPEITVENVKKHMGLDITIVTTALNDDEGRELLRLLGMPFRRTEPAKVAAA